MAEVSSLATLGLVIDAKGARREIRETTGELKQLGAAGTDALKRLMPSPAVVQQMNRVTEAMKRMKESIHATQANAMAAMIAKADPFQRGIAKAAAETEKLAAIAGKSRLNIAGIGAAFSTLAVSATGLPGPLGKVSSILGTFALGSGPMVAVLAGIAALAFAWDRVTSKARTAREESQKTEAYLRGLGRQQQFGDFADPRDAFVKSGEEINALRNQIKVLEASRKAAAASTPQLGFSGLGANVDASRAGQNVAAIDAELAKLRAAEAEKVRLAQFASTAMLQIDRERTEEKKRLAKEAADKEIAELERLKKAQREYQDFLGDRNSVALPGLSNGMRAGGSGPLAGMSFGADAFASLAAVGQRAKAAVERTAEAWQTLADIAKDEAKKARNRALVGMGVQAGLGMLSQFGGQAGGLVSGVAGAAMQGFAAGGPWGAAIAGVTSLTSGILGMGKASREAARQMAEAQRLFKASFAFYVKGSYGQISDRDQAAEQLRQQYEAMEQQIQVTFGGKKNEAERERLLRQNEQAYRRYLENLDKTTAAMEKAAKVDGFRKIIDELTSTIENLAQFKGSLLLSDQSALSPMQKLQEARRQYEEIVGKARGGDQNSANQLPQFAQAYLAASRAVNASGFAYQQDFARVVRDTDEIMKLFEGQRDIAQKQLDVLTGLRDGTADAARQAHTDAERTRQAIEELIETTRAGSESVETVI